MSGGRKYRILLVSHTAGLYGAERSLATLAEGLQKRRVAKVMVLLPDSGPLRELLQAKGIQTHVIRSFRWIGNRTGVGARVKWLARTPLNVIAALRAWLWARRWNPDLICTNTIVTPIGVSLALCLRKPHIWHIREWISSELNATFDLGQSFVMSVLARSRSPIIFNSSGLADIYIAHLPGTRPVVVYNGFDFSGVAAPRPAEHYASAVEDAKTIRLAIIGSVYPIKGQDEAIRALALLLDEGLQVRLEIIGSGSPEYLKQLETLTTELGIADHVFFRGYSDDVPGQLKDTAVTLIPSRFEPFGRIAVESIACGTPVVAASVGGLKEIVSDGVTGMLYSPGTPAELAEKISKLLRDRDLYLAIVHDGWRDVTQRFSTEQYIDGVWDIFTETLDKEAGGGTSAGE